MRPNPPSSDTAPKMNSTHAVIEANFLKTDGISSPPIAGQYIPLTLDLASIKARLAVHGKTRGKYPRSEALLYSATVISAIIGALISKRVS